MLTTKLSTKGQVIIPSEMRERCRLRVGDRFAVDAGDGVITLTLLERHPALELRGILVGVPSLTKALADERSVEQAKEAPVDV